MKKAIDKIKLRKEKTEGKLVKIPFLCMTVFFFSCFFITEAFAEGKWVEVSGTWQYQENGVARKGWLHLGDSWYYLDPTSGKMADGWILDSGKWYFLKTDAREQGKMATGWTWVDGNCYFLKENGAMASNESVGGYQLAESGQWTVQGKAVFEKDKGYAKSYSAYLQKNGVEGNATQSSASGESVPLGTGSSSGGGLATRTGSGGGGGGGSFSGSSGGSSGGGFSSGAHGGTSSDVSSSSKTAEIKSYSAFEPGKTEEEETENSGNSAEKEIAAESEEGTETTTKETEGKTEEEHRRDADQVERALQEGENQNTAQYTAANGEIYTAFFVQGVHIPNLKSTEEGGDFIEKEDSGYFTRVARFARGQGYYDTNKARNGQNKDVDRNLCFATTASNVLHWYLQENKEKIQDYIHEHGDVVRRVGQKNYSLEDFLDQSSPDQWNSRIFDYFKLIYGHSKNGFYTGPLVDLFLNGYTPKKATNTKADFESMDERGGFLYGLLKEKLQTDDTGNFKGTFSEDVKKHLAAGHALCISYRPLGTYSHVVSLWGADFDESGKLVGVYVTDSDDQDETGEDPEVGLKYYRIIYKDGSPYLNNSLNPKSNGSRISKLHSFGWKA
nr:IdeS/Mac family cysteine endopeptidase [uncultured Oribacterium sp.]